MNRDVRQSADAESTWDCHVEVSEHGYHRIASDNPTAVHAPLGAYRLQQKEQGTHRVVLFQPAGYGVDNRCMLDTLRELGDGARGIARIFSGISRHGLIQLHGWGVRGLRFSWHELADVEQMRRLSRPLADLGWLASVALEPTRLDTAPALMQRLPGRFLIENVGELLTRDPGDATVDSLHRLLETGRCWLRLTPARSDPLAALDRQMERLAVQAPERCVWGSGWPAARGSRAVAHQQMVLGSERIRRAVLVETPELLFGG